MVHLFEQFSKRSDDRTVLTIFPYSVCEDPPRPAEGTLQATEMAGYMAGRGDFMTEHENYMELDLRSLRFDADDERVEAGWLFHVQKMCSLFRYNVL